MSIWYHNLVGKHHKGRFYYAIIIGHNSNHQLKFQLGIHYFSYLNNSKDVDKDLQNTLICLIINYKKSYFERPTKELWLKNIYLLNAYQINSITY